MTLKEMAAELGVSAPTISRILNGSNKNFSVKPEIREKVLKYAKDCGYHANPVFKAIRASRNRQISFMFPTPSILKAGHTAEEAIDEASAQLKKAGYSSNYLFVDKVPKDQYPPPAWKVDGLVFPDPLSGSLFREIESKNQAYVCLNGPCGEHGAAVLSDEYENTRLILEYLVSMGHTRIGYLDYHHADTGHYSVRDRRAAWNELRKKKGLPEMPESIRKYDALKEMFDQQIQAGATALVTYDEVMLNEILYYAWRRGLRVPDNLSLITYNNTREHDFIIPPMTSLEIPAREIGREVARIILERIENNDAHSGETIALPGRLIIRESVSRRNEI